MSGAIQACVVGGRPRLTLVVLLCLAGSLANGRSLAAPAPSRALVRRFEKAQRLRLPPVRPLFGFSRVIDVKVDLSPSLLERLAAGVDVRKVEALIDRGPGEHGRWGLIRTPEQLVAALVHHQVTGKGRALQLSIAAPLEAHVQGAIAGLRGRRARRVVGAAAAVGANLAAVLGLSPGFHSAQAPSAEQ